MLFDGIKLVEGSEVQNLVVDAGTAFPSLPNDGELFYMLQGGAATNGLYVYETASTSWVRLVQQNDSFASLLPPSGVTAGTYKSVTVDSVGIVTAGSNPTTLAGYGISDAQPLDADLTAIAVISANAGLLRKTASNTWSLDTATYITGNQTITLSGDLTGSGTTSISASLGATGVAAGSYGTATSVPTIAVDSKGRVTSASNTPISIDASAVSSGTLADVRVAQSNVTQYQSALSITEAQVSGTGTILARVAANEMITGTWSFANEIAGIDPTSSTHLATKNYVDNVAAGLTAKASVKAATTGNITLSGLQSVDGYTTVAGDRILVKAQTDATQNGVYTASGSTWVRSTDMDGTPANDIATGDNVFVEGGSTNANTSWVIITTGAIILGTTPVLWSLFNRAGGLSVAGGLTLSGNTLAVGTASSSRIVVNAFNIDLATAGTAGTYASVTTDAYGRVTAGSTTLAFSSLTGTPTTLAGYGITNGQPLNSNLTGISGVGTTGIVAITGIGSADTISIAVSGVGLSIANASGAAGNPTITSNATALNTASTIIARDSSGNFAANTITASLAGNALTASALATPRTIAATGDATWSVNFDGSANATAALTLATVNSNAGTFGSASQVPSFTVNAKGLITAASAVALSTSNVAEGSNLYFTTSRAQGAIGVSGTGLSYASGVITSNATSANTASTIVARDSSGNFTAGTITANLTGNVTGNASTATSAGKSTNIAGGAAGSLPYQTAADTTAMLPIGTGGYVLTSASGLPAWAPVSGLSVGSATDISITDNNTDSSTVYPAWSPNTSGNQPISTSSTKLSFVPSTGILTATEFSGSGSALTSIPNSALVNSSVTIGSTNVALGATATSLAGLTSVAATTFTGALSGNATSATSIAGGAANSIPYQTGSGATGFLAVGSGVLQETSGAPAWTTTPSISGANFTAGSVTNAALTNSSVTVNGTSIALGASGTVTAAAGTLTGTTLNSSVTGSSLTSLGVQAQALNMGSNQINNVAMAATPAGTDAVNVNYVQAAIAGLTWKNEVACATTANITLSGEQTIDGVTTSSSRVLVKNQTTQSQNGIYISGTGAWTRSTDGATGAELLNAAMYVDGGTTQAATGWVNTNTSAITIGTTAVTFAQFSGSGTYAAGTGLTLTGNTFATAAIPNSSLTNSSVTIGSTTIALGTTSTSLSGLTAVTATNFIGVASSATNIASGSANQIPYQTAASTTSFFSAANYGVQIYGATGTPSALVGAAGVLVGSASATPTWSTSPSISGANITASTIANGSLANSSVTIGTTAIALGSSATTIVGLTSVTSTTFVGALTGNASTATTAGTVTTAAQPTITSVGTLTGLAVSGYIQKSVGTAISAAGTTLGTATVLTHEINDVTTVASGTGVALPSSVGTTFIVMNHGANALLVYPTTTSGVIDSGAAGAGLSLPVGAKIMFVQTATNQYYTLNATYA